MTKIKSMKNQLTIKNKVIERKVHYRVLDLITTYEIECFPSQHRQRFSDRTAVHVLKAEYHRMIMQQLNDEVLKRKFKIEQAEQMAAKVVEEVFSQIDDPSFKQRILLKLNNAYQSQDHNENFLSAVHVAQDKPKQSNIFESVLLQIEFKAKTKRLSHRKFSTLTMESFNFSEAGSVTPNNFSK